MTHTPYLVQRLVSPWHIKENAKGVDRYFSMDYMGSAEFEFGALPKALKAMRAACDNWQPRKMKVKAGLPQTDWKDQVAWYVGPPELYDIALKLFKTELREELEFRLKEGSRIAQAYGLDHLTASKIARGIKPENFYERLVGWWDVQSTYAFFTKKEHAYQWLKGLSNG